MGDIFDAREQLNFYTGHLANDLLPFWLRAVDWEDGGFYNCYDNTGSRLIREDKYTWSQGRFVWIFAKLAVLRSNMFGSDERHRWLELAGHGARFLMRHAVMDNGHCTFLMDKHGRPIPSAPDTPYDASIFADCFVAIGLARYAAAAKDRASLAFAKQLYASIRQRIRTGDYLMAPYPTPDGYRSHSIPMILLNVTHELLEAATLLEDGDGKALVPSMHSLIAQIMLDFTDENGILHEMIREDGSRSDTTLLDRYCNPGHAIEDMWFVIHASMRLQQGRYIKKAGEIVKNMMRIGWDEPYGGLLLFVDQEGGIPRGDTAGMEQAAMVGQIGNNWHQKLWWPHSEALYTTLLCYRLTGDPDFLRDYERVRDYTFRTFPNPDKRTGEWIQIRSRGGEPAGNVVALPVKDPYHIIRNVALIIELLEGMSNGTNKEWAIG